MSIELLVVQLLSVIVYLLQDLKTGRSRGYGFVEMETLEDAESALSSPKQQIDNYTVIEFLSNSHYNWLSCIIRYYKRGSWVDMMLYQN